eukprot:15356363-Ditylum_brightwellii.AAC.1
MSNQRHQTCNILQGIKRRAEVDYAQRQRNQNGGGNPPPPPPPQGGPQQQPPQRQQQPPPQATPPAPPPANNEGAAKRTQEEDLEVESSDNQINEESNTYLPMYNSVFTVIGFEKPTHRYMTQVVSNISTTNYDQLVMILGSATTKHMSGIKQLFICIHMFPPGYNGYITLGGGKTRLAVKGNGDIQVEIKQKIIKLS